MRQSSGQNFYEGRDLFWVDFNLSVGSEVYGNSPKATTKWLGWVELHFKFVQDSETFMEGSYVVVFSRGFNEHIVYVYLHCLAKLFSEHLFHQALVGRVCIFNAEGHHFVIVGPSICDEARFILVF